MLETIVAWMRAYASDRAAAERKAVRDGWSVFGVPVMAGGDQDSASWPGYREG